VKNEMKAKVRKLKNLAILLQAKIVPKHRFCFFATVFSNIRRVWFDVRWFVEQALSLSRENWYYLSNK
jgi:hypothetical protein